MHSTLDLNCDVGEISFEQDCHLLPWVSSCNVSCGAHAGDTSLSTQTVQAAARLGVAIGAHPSYPDRENFGRKTPDMSYPELLKRLVDQVRSLQAIVQDCGHTLSHIKPHGALYNDLTHNQTLAAEVLGAFQRHFPECAIYGMAGSCLGPICESLNLRFVAEAFADRNYADAGTLVPRTDMGALIIDINDFQTHFARLLQGQILDSQARLHRVAMETICIHSDTPSAVTFAKLANELMKGAHVSMASARR